MNTSVDKSLPARVAGDAPRPPRRPIRWLLASLLSLAAAVAALGLALALALRLFLAPAPGEWSTRVSLGPAHWDIGVPSAIRLVTSHWLAPWLDGRTLRTGFGLVRLGWQADAATLTARCAPCTVPLPGLGGERVTVPALTLSVRRQFEQLTGTLEATNGPVQIRAAWTGQLAQDGLQLTLDVAEAPLAHWYAVFAAPLPELRRAAIGGTLALRATLALPQQRLELLPVLQGFSVSGLGTDNWLGARSACGAPSGLGADSWLARAVIAAEDQRFAEHGGYDPRELLAAHTVNQARGAIARGGSTLNQQLAKLLVTGAERSHTRKLRELLYAVEMERTLGKARILGLYLDNAPWGPGLCGAEAAARRYFGRPAQQLTPAQAVWLAAMLHNPGLEAERWAQTGQINLSRAQWVAGELRGGGRQARLAAMAAFARDPRWPAPVPQGW